MSPNDAVQTRGLQCDQKSHPMFDKIPTAFKVTALAAVILVAPATLLGFLLIGAGAGIVILLAFIFLFIILYMVAMRKYT